MIKAYWWDARYKFHNPGGIYNFGDQLTHTLLTHLGVEHEWAEPGDAELVVCGSLLEHLPCCWPGKVVGAGKLHERSELHLEHTDILAVRGPLTAGSLGKRRHAYGMGDPGLLASDLIPPRQIAYPLGVIPHWSDRVLANRFAYGHVISPMSGPMHVMAEIARCGKVVTSSLHGMIVADSLGIPRQVEMFDKAVREGGDFKYRDYAMSLNDTPHFGTMHTPSSSMVELRKREIRDALAQI